MLLSFKGIRVKAIRKQSVMVIDDDQSVVEVLKDVLSAEGFPVIWAKSSGATYDLLHTFVPQIFLLDYWITGGENGITVAKWIRKQKKFDAIPIIFLTAADEKPKEMQTIKHATFLEKPFEIAVLTERVYRELHVTP